MGLPECPRAQLGVALDRPTPGFFALRLGRLPPLPGKRIGAMAPWTPAVIYAPCPFVECEPFETDPETWFYPTGRQPNPLRAMVAEKHLESTEMVIRIWQGGRGIPRSEYFYLMVRRAWARRYDPTSYHAQPPDLRVLKNRDTL